MNYRHGFHAGNFADVLKHSIFVACLTDNLRQSEPFTVIDTHAGAGLYNLGGAEAEKTGEWRHGVGRVWDCTNAPDIVAGYVAAIRAIQTHRAGGPSLYPGSPLLADRFLRACDRLIALDLHPPTYTNLRDLLRKSMNATSICADGYAYLEQVAAGPQGKGLVLIDPPFEAEGEFETLSRVVKTAYESWPNGQYVVWYPTKDLRKAERFEAELASHAIPNFLCATLATGSPSDGLTSCRVGVINPPRTLHNDLTIALPWLADRLSAGAAASSGLEWLGAPE